MYVVDVKDFSYNDCVQTYKDKVSVQTIKDELILILLELLKEYKGLWIFENISLEMKRYIFY